MGTVALNLSLNLKGDDSGDLAGTQPSGASLPETQGLLEPLKTSGRQQQATVNLHWPTLSLLLLFLLVLIFCF